MTATLNALTAALVSLVVAVAIIGTGDIVRDLASAQITAGVFAPTGGSAALFPVRF